MNNETKVLEIFVDDIIPNRFQPRLSFDDAKIAELSNSIKVHGIIQPLVLRQVADKYEIIAGERRYKAAIMAGLQKVPAIISNLDDNKSAEVALVENIQRRDLSAIEEAKSYKKLLDRGYLTQEQLAGKMGISQSSLANKLRLLNLDEAIQKALLEEKISERHARSLLSVSDFEKQKELLQRIISERLTVKQLDGEIKKMSDNQSNENKIFIEMFDDKNENISIDAQQNNGQLIEESSPTGNRSIDIFSNEPKTSSFVDLAKITQESANSFVKPNQPAEIFSSQSFEDSPIEKINFSSSNVSDIFNLSPTESVNLTSNNTSNSSSVELINNIIDSNDLKKKDPTEISIKIDKANFKTVENAFESLKEQIIASGLKIDMDTYSFDEYYQLIIKVYK